MLRDGLDHARQDDRPRAGRGPRQQDAERIRIDPGDHVEARTAERTARGIHHGPVAFGLGNLVHAHEHDHDRVLRAVGEPQVVGGEQLEPAGVQQAGEVVDGLVALELRAEALDRRRVVDRSRDEIDRRTGRDHVGRARVERELWVDARGAEHHDGDVARLLAERTDDVEPLGVREVEVVQITSISPSARCASAPSRSSADSTEKPSRRPASTPTASTARSPTPALMAEPIGWGSAAAER